MKFPVAFRIFASLNLVGFLILFFLSIILFYSPLEGSWFTAVCVLSAIWLLVSSIAWFFASKRSYSLLVVAPVMVFILGISLLVVMLTSDKANTSSGQIVFIISGGLCFIYSIFLFVSLGFRPIKEWKQSTGSAAFDGVFTSAFIALLLVAAGVSYYFDTVARSFIVLNTNQVSQVVSNTEVVFDFYETTEFDAIVLLKGDERDRFEAVVYFADSYTVQDEAAYSTTRKVQFEPFALSSLRAGEGLPTVGNEDVYLIARFPTVAARRMMIKTLDRPIGSEQLAVTTLHSVSLFDKSTYREQFLYANEEFADEPASEEEYSEYIDGESFVVLEEPDKAQAESITPELANKLQNNFFNDLLANPEASYYFNTHENSLQLGDYQIGRYLHFRSILDFVPLTLNQFLFDNGYNERATNYNFNSAIWKLTGQNFSSPDNRDLPFTALNGALVEWVRLNMVPKPGDKILDKAAYDVYHAVFRKVFWQLAAAHEYLDIEDYYADEADAYKAAMYEESFQAMHYLYNRYEQVNATTSHFNKVTDNIPSGEYVYDYFTEQVAIGFWLRRKIDGSDEEVWKLVQEVLQTYDAYPFGNQ